MVEVWPSNIHFHELSGLSSRALLTEKLSILHARSSYTMNHIGSYDNGYFGLLGSIQYELYYTYYTYFLYELHFVYDMIYFLWPFSTSFLGTFGKCWIQIPEEPFRNKIGFVSIIVTKSSFCIICFIHIFVSLQSRGRQKFSITSNNIKIFVLFVCWIDKRASGFNMM